MDDNNVRNMILQKLEDGKFNLSLTQEGLNTLFMCLGMLDANYIEYFAALLGLKTIDQVEFHEFFNELRGTIFFDAE